MKKGQREFAMSIKRMVMGQVSKRELIDCSAFLACWLFSMTSFPIMMMMLYPRLSLITLRLTS